MQYALLIYEDESVFGPGKTGPELQQVVGRHIEFKKELGAKHVGGSGLKATSSATTVRTTGGKQTLHDGPFAETKEQLGGFYLIQARISMQPLPLPRKSRCSKTAPSKCGRCLGRDEWRSTRTGISGGERAHRRRTRRPLSRSRLGRGCVF